MNVQKSVLAIVAAVTVGVAVPKTAAADDWNKQTVMTFDKDVQLPGKVLPAGTYVFQLVDSENSRHVVQVFDRDGNIVTTVLTIPAVRQTRTGGTKIVFEEKPAGTPVAIKQWFYPGDLTGEEFLYFPNDMTSFNN
jgi:hypothetical protein